MDPKACLTAMLDSEFEMLPDGTSVFREYMSDLIHWFAMGGFGVDVTVRLANGREVPAKLTYLRHTGDAAYVLRNGHTRWLSWRNIVSVGCGT